MTTTETCPVAGVGASPNAGGLMPLPPTDPAPLQPFVFSTQGVEARHRFELWRSKYESFNALQPVLPVTEEFDACNEIWSFGSMALMRNSAPAMRFERGRQHIRRDSIDHWVIRLTHRGRSRMRLGEVDLQTGPGQLLLFTLGQPHEGDRSEADWISLYIPRDSFPDLSAGLSLLGPRVLDVPGARLLADYMTMIESRMSRLLPSELPALVESMRAMVAACLLHGACRQAAAEEMEVARLERIRCVIRRNIGSATLGPEKVCRLAGVSRSQLYRLFEPHGGVARYIQAQRLRLAHAMLGDPDCRLSIRAVAERVGHFDASAFSRAFRQEFGYSPRDARAAALGGQPPPAADAAMNPGAADFIGVLRRIGFAGEPHRNAA
ncbi:helix-turn-helix domain-containing protein [Roseicella aquatilis]|uniref:Helix-turn-helix domain-containing protein n=2 Tax=Roseicella aquatilis TaxID=2527868 RepID=A0A4R4DSP9_9PROT|nr:helix-turn-helix domain-containing protein [Roseicella aquatilis]